MNKKVIELLDLLHKNQQQFISGEEISRQLGVSRTAVWKYIQSLRLKGYFIDSVPNRGYALLKRSESIVPEEVLLGLNTNIMGREIRYFQSTGSTNEQAKELARDGAVSGTLVLADEQLSGRGRRGRKWLSPAGTGLWFSLIIRPDFGPERAPYLTIISSLALVEVLEKHYHLQPEIKWPNDILLQGRKVSGILSELSAELGKINYAVVGIGINVNQDYFPAELKEIATSLKLALGKEIDRTALLQNLLYCFEKYYQQLTAGEEEQLLQLWKNKLNVLNKEIVLYSNGQAFLGKAVDVSTKGELLLKTVSGEVITFWAGDTSLREKK